MRHGRILLKEFMSNVDQHNLHINIKTLHTNIVSVLEQLRTSQLNQLKPVSQLAVATPQGCTRRMRPPGPGGPGGPPPPPPPPPGPGFPPPWPGPVFCNMISSCFYALCCCWLLQDCFGGPPPPPPPAAPPPGGGPFPPAGPPPP